MARTINVVHYAALSSHESGVYPSTKTQHDRLDQDSRMKGERVVARYSETNVTGFTMRGSELQQALADLREGRAQVIKVTKMDRLVRNNQRLWQLQEQVAGYGAEIFTLEETWDFTSARGKLIANLMGGVAQYWRDISSEEGETKARARVVFERNPNGMSPFGYERNDDGGFEPVENEVAMLRQLGAWLLEFGSVSEVLFLAEAHGFRTRPRRSRESGTLKPGNPFTWTTLDKMLRRRTYLGEIGRALGEMPEQCLEDLNPDGAHHVEVRPVRDGVVDVTLWYRAEDGDLLHEPVFSEEEFAEIQRVLRRNEGAAGRGDRRNNTRAHLLTGRVWCGETREAPDHKNPGHRYERLVPWPAYKTRYRVRVLKAVTYKDEDLQPGDVVEMAHKRYAAEAAAGTVELVEKVNKIYHYYRRESTRRPIRARRVEVLGEDPEFNGLPAEELERVVIERLIECAGDDAWWDTASRLTIEAQYQALAQLARRRGELVDETARAQEHYNNLRNQVREYTARRVPAQILCDMEDDYNAAKGAVTTCAELADDLDTLERWYKSWPGLIEEARAGYLRLKRNWEMDHQRAVQKSLLDVLQDPYGVVVYNDRIEIRRRLSPVLDEDAVEFVKIEENRAREDSNPRPSDP